MKSKSWTPLIAAGALVALLVAGTVYLRGQGARAPADAATADAPAATPAPVPAAAVPAGGRRGTPVATADANDPIERRARLRREHEERTRALRERNIERYSTEQVDPAWAPQKISELTAVADNEAFQTAGAKPQSLSVDCRTSMCRIDGQFEDSGKAEDWILMYMSGVGSAMPNSVVSRRVNPDGTVRVEIYGRAR